jgi:hypothetical protein
MFELVKQHKRLWIREVETGKCVYTPPDFMRHRLQSRAPMQVLAGKFNDSLRFDIQAIIDFEAAFSRK